MYILYTFVFERQNTLCPFKKNEGRCGCDKFERGTNLTMENALKIKKFERHHIVFYTNKAKMKTVYTFKNIGA